MYSEAKKAEYAAVSETPGAYDVRETIAALQKEMLEAADALEFERAAFIRDQLACIMKQTHSSAGTSKERKTKK